MRLLFNFVFILFSIMLGIRTIAYGIYEIKQNKNKAGGIGFILFCLIVIIFCNIAVWL